jgi:hypothetical protein
MMKLSAMKLNPGTFSVIVFCLFLAMFWLGWIVRGFAR